MVLSDSDWAISFIRDSDWLVSFLLDSDWFISVFLILAWLISFLLDSDWLISFLLLVHSRCCQNERNGAMPVPGPTKITGLFLSLGRWKLGALEDEKIISILLKIKQQYNSTQLQHDIINYCSTKKALLRTH